MIAVGDESSRTQGKHVLFDKDTSLWIWDITIETAEPYSHSTLSGYRTLEIYSKTSNEKPAVTLYVNETDSTHIKGDSQGYMCRQLHHILVSELNKKADVK